MAEGNGVDSGAVYQLLRQVADNVLKLTHDVAELKQDIAGLKRDKADKSDVVGLRQAVVQYHASVLGHGILISELEARVRRVEDHLHLPPMIAAE